MKKKKVYCAGGWFTQEQSQAMDFIYKTADEFASIDSYQPRIDCLFNPNIDNSEEIFSTNISTIDNCEAIFASVEGKDMGTLFECGYAYAKSVPIIYIWLENHGHKFNLMLARSAVRVCMSEQEVLQAFWDVAHNQLTPIEYNGEME